MTVLNEQAVPSSDPLDTRRRRATWRAHHRGTKEMDWLIGKFADANLAEMTADELTVFEQFLAISDPELQPWLMDAPSVLPLASPDPAFAGLISRIRKFHGLSPLPDAAATR